MSRRAVWWITVLGFGKHAATTGRGGIIPFELVSRDPGEYVGRHREVGQE